MPYPVSNLIEGRGIPISVNSNIPVLEALSVMLDNDFSQLPVLNDKNEIIGMITYESILRSIKHYKANLDDLVVQNALESVDKFDLENDVFDMLKSLQLNNAALITGTKDELVGIVTNYDIAEYFRNRSEDLMLIEEIELIIRELIEFAFLDQKGELKEKRIQSVINKITDNIGDRKEDFRKGLFTYLNLSNGDSEHFDSEAFEKSFLKIYKNGTNKSFDELTLSDFIEILVYEDCWEYYRDIFKIDQNLLRNMFNEVRKARNQLAHFRGELTSDQRDNLEFCKKTVEFVHDTIDRESEFVQQEDEIFETEPSEGDFIPPVGEETTISTSKYAPLEDYLRGIPGSKDKLRLSFKEIEKIIDDELPPSAYTRRSWWANDSVGHVQSKHWLSAGWKVGYRNISNKEVSFGRIKEREKAYISFFGPLKTRLDKELDLKLRDTAATGVNWITLIGIPETRIMAQIAICFANQSRYRIELYIDTEDKETNKIIFDELHAQKETIEEKIGEPLGWERLENKRASRIALYTPGNIEDDKAKMKELNDWTAEMLPVFYEAIVPEVNKALEKHTS